MEYEEKAHGLKRQHPTNSDSDRKARSRRAGINPAPNLKGRRRENSTTAADAPGPTYLSFNLHIQSTTNS